MTGWTVILAYPDYCNSSGDPFEIYVGYSALEDRSAAVEAVKKRCFEGSNDIHSVDDLFGIAAMKGEVEVYNA